MKNLNSSGRAAVLVASLFVVGTSACDVPAQPVVAVAAEQVGTGLFSGALTTLQAPLTGMFASLAPAGDAAGENAPALAPAYLGSDIPATSAMVGWGEYQVDSNWYGSGFNIGGVHYTKGIFAHAPSRVTFPLGGAYTMLTGCVGQDDADTHCGNGSKVSVYSGIALRWTSNVGNGSVVCIPPLNVSGVAELTLVADSKGNKDCDEVEWVNMLVQ